MTDETTTPEDAPEPVEEQPPITLYDVWGTFYERVLAHMAYNTNNKADKQQYRIAAAQVAVALTGLETRIR